MTTTEDRGPVFDGVKLGRPATGALIDAGYSSLEDLPADLDSLGDLHGVGPSTIRTLRSVLAPVPPPEVSTSTTAERPR